MTDYNDQYQELSDNYKLLTESSSEVMTKFYELKKQTIKEGALDIKSKELIALGIAIALRCEGCILSHVKACINLGATLEEISETIEVAILMGGGPSTVYGGKALALAVSLFKK
ncbi:carboxymuconolactone decarboxylase family protein [Vagococcus intermedius]|uniref:Carboxymuconolactone decarboxylase family protein n=1 Tax=Vagococcus intermedius TaxID=2991418 RepID=A0AAF0IA83_9ENTE|nr:carboxymuconolactone decarboxylase family protein [Vagococcus intermedius]WEG74237.1 carboxymuconolactone decarboxylase family protein [Vagococcus intermedius]WEG76319.1 carboxymuconolactone decarboxylase family protein [Vagococcus intermedius]